MDDKRPPQWPTAMPPNMAIHHTTAMPLQHYAASSRPLHPLPPMLPAKRNLPEEDWHVSAAPANHIAANHMAANHMAANHIATNHIAANHIAANHMAANHIATNHIAANHMAANHIATNHIASNHIATNHIAANHIATNHIAANHIAANHAQGIRPMATAHGASPRRRQFRPAPPAAGGYDDNLYSPRRTASSADSFMFAATMGARAQTALDTNGGQPAESYGLGRKIIASSKLYANQRRSNRQLPGGSDSTTAACYMIGGTPDPALSQLLSNVSPWDPREERCKAVERVLKDKTRGAICALNGENPREARADNLAAVRICEVVADVLVAYSSRLLLENRDELAATVSRQEGEMKQLKEELAKERRLRAEKESECWCRGQPAERNVTVPVGVSVASQPMGDLHSFERNKLLRRGILTSSGHRSFDSDRNSLVEGPERDAGGG